ncbi:hypothetical protein QP179_09890 [Sphingomonas aurantiaca]|uniref:hypothetical protein n=1 Tax=Sphingomonas aurantiaca TaxID=185949 RepID=UPI002FE0DC4B
MHYTNRFAFTRSYNRTTHARNRARQRYGIDLSPALSIRIAQAVRDGLSRPLGRNVHAVSLSIVDPTLPDIEVIVAYDTWRNEIASFLPPDWTVAKAEAHDAAHSVPALAKPSAHVPVQPDLVAMTMDDAVAWRSTLVEALETAGDRIDRRVIHEMIVTANDRIKAINLELQEAKRVKARVVAKDRKKALKDKESRLQEMFREMWGEDRPDQ